MCDESMTSLNRNELNAVIHLLLKMRLTQSNVLDDFRYFPFKSGHQTLSNGY